MTDQDFDITKPPPAKDTDAVGKWVWDLFELSRDWRDGELNMPGIWRANHALYRGNHWGTKRKKNNISLGLFFSNVQRTVANICSKQPVAEIIDLDGKDVEYSKVATKKIGKWWLETNQLSGLRMSVLNSEIYGITWEKAVWNGREKQPAFVICDPFSIFPYPGYYEDIQRDCPALCHGTAEEPSVVQNKYGTKEEVQISETYSLLGKDRKEKSSRVEYGLPSDTSSDGNSSSTARGPSGQTGELALVVECWFRDDSKDEDGVSIYPGGIRMVTVANDGKLVLADKGNPNINRAYPQEIIDKNYLSEKFPFFKNNSYVDSTSIFGFSAAEQTGLLNVKIDELASRLTDYAMRAMLGIFIIPKSAGIPKSSVLSAPGLVLRPDTDHGAQGIRFVSFPSVPQSVFQVLDFLVNMHDRIHAIEDVDRGQTPKNITAASAIVALQERNAALIQYKIDAVDAVITNRGRCWVALEQMHGHHPQTIEVDSQPVIFQGDVMAPMDFDYVVETSSTVVRTSLQEQEQAMALAQEGFIDQTALLEALNVGNASEIIERMADDKLGQAMEILVQAGMPEEYAQQVYQVLQEAQGGTGRTKQDNPPVMPQAPQPGTPKAQQGEVI